MYESVRDAFIELTKPLEGWINYMYCDTVRLVTTGLGIMMPDDTSATYLAWRWIDTNRKATVPEIRTEWRYIKRLGSLGDADRPASYYKKYASLFLPDSEITKSAMNKLYEMEAEVVKFVGQDYRYWPADAQMAVLQMAWNVGPNMFNNKAKAYWPNLTSALKMQDWKKALDHCQIGGNAKTPRNVLVKRLFNNALKVTELNANKAVLWNKTEPTPPPKPSIIASKVKFGSTNGEVWKLQERLKALKYTIVVDGVYGNQTRNIVMLYQTNNKLVVDGWAGPVTLRSLGFEVK